MPHTLRLLAPCLVATLVASCVDVDPHTHEVIPRGNQAYEFTDVERYAEDLKLGMTPREVQLLLGSPAEKNTRGDVWIYLPERPAVIVPGRALRLEFKHGQLAKHGYHAIVLGAQL